MEVDEEAAAIQRQTRMFACAGIAKFWLRENELVIERLSRRTIHSEETIKEKLAADIVYNCYAEIALEKAQELMEMHAIDPRREDVRKWVQVDWEQFYSSNSIKLSREQEELVTLAEEDQQKLQEEAAKDDQMPTQPTTLLNPAIPLTAIILILVVIAWIFLRKPKPTLSTKKEKKLKRR